LDKDPFVEQFLSLSEALTGFIRFDLLATSFAEQYCQIFRNNIGSKTLSDIFEIWARIVSEHPAGDQADSIASDLMGDPVVRAALQRLIMLWYTGSWYDTLPYGEEVVSPQSFVEGLMWRAMAAHPMAAKPQGYGAWALEPPKSTYAGGSDGHAL